MISRSHTLKSVLVLACLAAFALTIVVNITVNTPGGSPFNVTVKNVSEKYMTGITPSNQTFSVWGLIYLWQFAVIIYSLTLLCRKLNGEPLITNPGMLPSYFYVAYGLNLISNPVWLYTFLSDNQVAAFVILTFGFIALVISLIGSLNGLDTSGPQLQKSGYKADIWAIRLVVQNGVALYLGWVSAATLVNGVVVFHYILGYSMDNCCLVALTVLLAVVLTWFVMGLVYDRQLRYVFAHYVTLLAALIGANQRNFSAGRPYSYYELILLTFVVVLAVVKLCVGIARTIFDPISYPQPADGVKYVDNVKQGFKYENLKDKTIH